MAQETTSLGGNTALIGIGCISISVFIFSVSSALGKLSTSTMPVGEFLFLRGFLALALLSPIFFRRGFGPIRDAPRKKLQLLRIALSSIEIAAFYLTVAFLPLADTIAFWLATPIYVTAFSRIFLKEKVEWRRWSAVAIGFFGVVLAMRPSGAGINWPVFIGVAGSVCYALVLIATRSLRQTSDAILICGPLTGSMIIGFVAAIFDHLSYRHLLKL